MIQCRLLSEVEGEAEGVGEGTGCYSQPALAPWQRKQAKVIMMMSSRLSHISKSRQNEERKNVFSFQQQECPLPPPPSPPLHIEIKSAFLFKSPGFVQFFFTTYYASMCIWTQLSEVKSLNHYLRQEFTCQSKLLPQNHIYVDIYDDPNELFLILHSK